MASTQTNSNELEQILQMKEREIKDLNIQLQSLQEYVKDSEKIVAFKERMIKDMPKNPAIQFYDPVLKRTIQRLSKENQSFKDILNEKYKSKEAADITLEIKEVRKENEHLREQLDSKFRDNQRLQQSLNSEDKKNDNLKKLTDKCSILQNENRIIRSTLLLQDQSNEYLKKCVDSQRDEFLKIFLQISSDEQGQTFIDAIRNLNSSQTKLPMGLLTPLSRDQSTDTKEIEGVEALRGAIADQLRIPKGPLLNKGGADSDSAIASMSDEIQSLNKMLRDSTEENESLKTKIDEVNFENETLKKERQNQQSNSEQFIDELLKRTHVIEGELTAARCTVEIREKEAKDFFTDIEKHKTENKQLKEELRLMKTKEKQLFDYVLQAQRRDNPPPIPPASRQLSTPVEPYQQQQYGWISGGIFPEQSGILVRDGAESPSPSPTKSASIPRDLGAQSRDYYSRQDSPPQQSPSRPPKSFSPTEKMELCEYCFREFPKGAVLFDHMMKCDKRYQRDNR
ncbi:uncharacterized protein MCAP_0864-like [Clytia hemisphaerica]|uniref:Uncharacterized protein n=1 Tax=Clytia hemisphaerica TaxID=252671 RepID=A0A7M5WK03_9CNID